MKVNLSKALDIASNVAVICASCIALFAFAGGFHRTPAQPEALTKGVSVSGIGGLKFEAPKTLVLAISADCPYCRSSVPFYAKLKERQRSAAPQVGIAVVTQDRAEEIRALLASAQTDIAASPRVNLKRFGIGSTPTILLVDRRGIVLESWRGKLSPPQEDALLARVFEK